MKLIIMAAALILTATPLTAGNPTGNTGSGGNA